MDSQDIFDEPIPGRESRIEVYRDSQSLMLKRCDVTIERLTRVFKVKKCASYYLLAISSLMPDSLAFYF